MAAPVLPPPYRHPGPLVIHPVWTTASPTPFLQTLFRPARDAFPLPKQTVVPSEAVLQDTKAVSILPQMYVIHDCEPAPFSWPYRNY